MIQVFCDAIIKEKVKQMAVNGKMIWVMRVDIPNERNSFRSHAEVYMPEFYVKDFENLEEATPVMLVGDLSTRAYMSQNNTPVAKLVIYLKSYKILEKSIPNDLF